MTNTILHLKFLKSIVYISIQINFHFFVKFISLALKQVLDCILKHLIFRKTLRNAELKLMIQPS